MKEYNFQFPCLFDVQEICPSSQMLKLTDACYDAFQEGHIDCD